MIFRIFQKKAKKRQLFQELGIKILFIVQNETRKVRAIRYLIGSHNERSIKTDSEYTNAVTLQHIDIRSRLDALGNYVFQLINHGGFVCAKCEYIESIPQKYFILRNDSNEYPYDE